MKSVNVTTHRELPVLLQTGQYHEFPESIRHYIKDTWVRQHAGFCKTGASDGDTKMKDRLRRRFGVILNLPSTFLAVALFPEAHVAPGEARIIGWTAFSLSGALHYLYVRKTYRHGGAGHLLLAAAARTQSTVVATHWAKSLPSEGILVEDGLTVEYVGSDALRGGPEVPGA